MLFVYLIHLCTGKEERSVTRLAFSQLELNFPAMKNPNYKFCLTKFDLRPDSKKKDLSQTRSVCKKFWSKQQSVTPLTKDTHSEIKHNYVSLC